MNGVFSFSKHEIIRRTSIVEVAAALVVTRTSVIVPSIVLVFVVGSGVIVVPSSSVIT